MQHGGAPFPDAGAGVGGGLGAAEPVALGAVVGGVAADGPAARSRIFRITGSGAPARVSRIMSSAVRPVGGFSTLPSHSRITDTWTLESSMRTTSLTTGWDACGWASAAAAAEATATAVMSAAARAARDIEASPKKGR
jgi:hypothetical protein